MTKTDYAARLQKGAMMLRQRSGSRLWWPASRIPSIRSCPYNSPGFQEWIRLLDFYDGLYEEAVQHNAELGLPRPQDPLARLRHYKGRDVPPMESVEDLGQFPVKDIEEAGFAIKVDLWGHRGYVAGGRTADRAIEAGERVLRPAEMADLVDLRATEPKEVFDEAVEAVWRVRAILG